MADELPDYQSSFNAGYLKIYMPENIDPEEVDDVQYLFNGIINQLRRRAKKAREAAATPVPEVVVESI